MKLPIYVAATGLVLSLLVVGGVFAVRPKRFVSQTPIIKSSTHPLILDSANGPRPDDRVVQINEALLAAAMSGDIAKAEKCLDDGADVNVIEDDSKTFTPLTYAVGSGEIEMTQFLLNHGADPNTNGVRLSAMYWAISVDPTEEVVKCIRLLLQNGADPWRQCVDGDRPIDSASYEGEVAITQMLIEYMPQLSAVQKRNYLQTAKDVALCKAAETGTLSEVQHLVENGANVNYHNVAQDSPLMAAVSRGSIAIINYLFAQGAKVNLRDIKDRTALMSIGVSDKYFGEEVSKTGAEVIDILHRHGAKLELRDVDGMTALMYAVQGNPQATTALLSHGAKVNVRDNFGRTALHYAVVARDVKSLEDLLAHGARINAQDKAGVTTFMLASVNPDTPNTAQQRDRRLQCLSILRRFKANTRLKDKEGQTATAYSRLEDSDFISAG